MQAVIRTGGKQYYVAPGDILEVDKLAGAIGDIITIDDVLMIAGDTDVTVGQPTVSDAAVIAKITGQHRGQKIRVFRYRPKKRIRVRRGHRQYLTRLAIQSIQWGDQEFVAPASAPAPEPEVDVLVVEESAIEDSAGEDIAADEPIVAEATEGSAADVENDVAAADEVAGENDTDKSDAEGKKE